MESNQLSKEFLAERDTRIFALKKSGLSNVDIGKRFNMTAAAVAAATKRQLKRLNSEAWLEYPEVLRLELERLDELQKNMWAQTTYRREVLDDGTEVVLEPDQRAVTTVLGIMDRRAKLLGMNVERSEVVFSGLDRGGDVVDVKSSLVGGPVASVSSGVSARDESLRLLELMSSSGVLDAGVVSNILDSVDGSSADVVEVEVLSERVDDVD